MLVSPPRTKFYFPALTGLRAIAAWIVFFFHFNPFPRNTILGQLIQQWNTGVAIFFVLSGFLICVRYFDRLAFSRQWFTNYIRNRFARIYPLYFLLTCLTFAVICIDPSYDAEKLWNTFTWKDKLLAFFLNIAILRSWFDHFIALGVRTAWTLTVEEVFYLLAPFLLVGLRRQPRLRLVGYAAGLIAIGCLLVKLPTAFHRYGFVSSWQYMFQFTFFGRCVEFLAGIYLALFLAKRFKDIPDKWPKNTLLGAVWIVTVWGLMSWASVAHPTGPVAIYQVIFLNNIVLVPGICIMLYGLIQEQSILRRVLASNTFSLLGKASYAFYLIHYGILNEVLERYVTENLMIRFIIINLVAIGLYKLVEHPMHKLLTKRPQSLS
jgi:peptidoglycan/LPS O-acetylase OafA/YrhL